MKNKTRNTVDVPSKAAIFQTRAQGCKAIGSCDLSMFRFDSYHVIIASLFSWKQEEDLTFKGGFLSEMGV